MMLAFSGFGLLALFSILSVLAGEDRRRTSYNAFDITLVAPRWTH